jgi:hypothetical protein
MPHTLHHTHMLVTLAALLLPAVVAILALSLLDLSEGLRAVLVLALGPFVLLGAALGYAASARPRGVRLAAAVAMAAMVGGCAVPTHTGSVAAQPQLPTTEQCAGDVGARAYPQGCDDAMTAQCGALAAEYGVAAHESPLDELGAECITDVPADGCSMMGDGGSLWIAPDGVRYCSTAIAWVELGLR